MGAKASESLSGLAPRASRSDLSVRGARPSFVRAAAGSRTGLVEPEHAGFTLPALAARRRAILGGGGEMPMSRTALAVGIVPARRAERLVAHRFAPVRGAASLFGFQRTCAAELRSGGSAVPRNHAGREMRADPAGCGDRCRGVAGSHPCRFSSGPRASRHCGRVLRSTDIEADNWDGTRDSRGETFARPMFARVRRSKLARQRSPVANPSPQQSTPATSAKAGHSRGETQSRNLHATTDNCGKLTNICMSTNRRCVAIFPAPNFSPRNPAGGKLNSTGRTTTPEAQLTELSAA